jgi:hypothetical protein
MFFFVRVFVVSVLAGVLALAVGFISSGIAYAWITRLHFPNYLLFASGIASLVLANAVFFSTMWLLLWCPHCGARFGWKFFFADVMGWRVPFPARTCVNCGSDTYMSKRARAEYLSNDLRNRVG